MIAEILARAAVRRARRTGSDRAAATGDPSCRPAPPLTKADFSSDQETRWCPGCGDYAVLASVQSFMPELGIPPDRIVFVTGIGCAGRFVYYMDTYGMHGIHGRAPALATGVATSRPDLSVWVVSGDGDALSIGGNHLIHSLRRNVPIKILLFNNQIYGLTKGQYSPTSEEGKVTKSTPFGSQDHPFNPVALALGAEATFVARTVDTDKQHLADDAARRRGAPRRLLRRDLPELQRLQRRRLRRRAREGPARAEPDPARARQAGSLRRRGRARRGARRRRPPRSGRRGGRGRGGAPRARRAPRRSRASRSSSPTWPPRPTGPTPIGVFRDVERPVYGEELALELQEARADVGTDDLEKLLHSGETWTVA